MTRLAKQEGSEDKNHPGARTLNECSLLVIGLLRMRIALAKCEYFTHLLEHDHKVNEAEWPSLLQQTGRHKLPSPAQGAFRTPLPFPALSTWQRHFLCNTIGKGSPILYRPSRDQEHITWNTHATLATTNEY